LPLELRGLDALKRFIQRNRTDLVIASVLTFGAFVIYYSLRSRWFDDWDCYNFAFSLTEYDVTKHQPHPYGYPTYVFVGKLFFIIMGSPVAALTTTSAFFGSIAFIPYYGVVKEISRSRFKAVVSCFLLAVLPQYWLNSEMMVSDIAGLSMSIFTVYLLYRWTISEKPIYLGLATFALGLSIGAREPNFILLLLFLYVLFEKRKVPKLRSLFFQCVLILFGTLTILYLPVVLLSGGPEAYLRAVWGYRDADFFYDLFNEPDLSFALLRRVYTYLVIFPLNWGLGVPVYSIYYPWAEMDVLRSSLVNSALGVLRFFLASAFAYCALKCFDWHNPKHRFTLFWFFAPFIFYFFLTGPANPVPRRILPMLPPACLILVAGATALPIFKSDTRIQTLSRTTRIIRKSFGLTPIILLILTLGYHTTMLVSILNTTPPAHEQLIQYLKQNFHPDTVVIFCFTEARAFQRFANEYEWYGAELPFAREQAFFALIPSDKKILVTETWANFIMDNLPERSRLRLLARFIRDPLVCWRDASTSLFEYVRTKEEMDLGLTRTNMIATLYNISLRSNQILNNCCIITKPWQGPSYHVMKSSDPYLYSVDMTCKLRTRPTLK